MKIDPFTRKRLHKFIEDFRAASGSLPTLKDFDEAGFPVETVDSAERQSIIEKLYVTLTNGTVVKGYKVKD